jgi:hypothetical protein
MSSTESAVTGVADWQHTHEENRRIGLVNGVLNEVATGLYLMSWLDRRRGRHRQRIVTSARMATRIDQLREWTVHKLPVKVRKSMLRAL